ncbi:LOW QUALITY PROTEIN: THO complex subunit 5 [Drosophila nasuta]|uniref:LOW QUALITY PROTEIN: THO complex subunit 5 n=1 Tax=Drosophila nasuta TaxID=42062 RepID=UPI001471DBE3|nr:LOW QUALITY PROTEIN: THO complex subunit 5 [Drosophila nasuta]
MENVLNKQFLKLKEAMDEILELKNNGHVFEVKQSSAALMFVALKHSNREVKRNIKSGRDELHLEKSKVDLSRLHLQNLLYEVSHLKKEIVRCQKFKSRDSYLELLSDKEYSNKFCNGSEDISNMTDHKTQLYRLECELKLRKELDNQYSGLLTSKQELLQDNLNQTQRYLSFAPALRTLLDSTKPLHDALQLSLDVEWKLSSIVKYLPRALYILYLNLESLQRANDKLLIKSEVVGFESDVQMQGLLSEQDMSLTERRYFTEVNNTPESRVNNVLERALKAHPLHIRLVMENPDKSYELVLLVRYWGLLKCTTVRAELNSVTPSNVQGDSSMLQNLLGHLFPDDLGNEIPVPGIEHELQNLKFSTEECMEYLNQNGFGKPYCWLQSMCSIATVNKKKIFRHELNLHKWTLDVFNRISKRWQSLMRLTQQVRGLTYKDIDLYSLKENIYPEGLSCSLVQWTVISTEEFNIQNSDLITNLPTENGITYTSYRAVIVRGSAKMECFIRIPSNYPMEIPLWILSVHWNGRRTAMNSSAIKMMEFWTNSLRPEHLEKNHRLLYAQLFRTIYSFDIFLETEGSMQSTREYNKEKPYISAFTKRIRLRPYRYVTKGSVHTFKQ